MQHDDDITRLAERLFVIAYGRPDDPDDVAETYAAWAQRNAAVAVEIAEIFVTYARQHHRLRELEREPGHPSPELRHLRDKLGV